VHVSQLSHKFVQDAREVVRTGQIVKVGVVEVDLERRRIALTMKLDAQVGATGGRGEARAGDNRYRPPTRGERAAPAGHRGGAAAEPQGAMAAAFSKLQGRR